MVRYVQKIAFAVVALVSIGLPFHNLKAQEHLGLEEWKKKLTFSPAGQQAFEGEAKAPRELQEGFAWLPNFDDRQEVALWYVNTFMIGVQGGSFHEISLEDVLRYQSKIPAATGDVNLRSAENLGFHSIAGIAPFEFTATQNEITLSDEQWAFFEEIFESLNTWYDIFHKKPIGALWETLSDPPAWMMKLGFRKTDQNSDQALAQNDRTATIEWSTAGITRILGYMDHLVRDYADAHDFAERFGGNYPYAQKILFVTQLLCGVVGQGHAADMEASDFNYDDPFSKSLPRAQRVRKLLDLLDFISHHQLPDEDNNGTGYDFLRKKFELIGQRARAQLGFKVTDQKRVTMLVASGLAAMLRGGFCRSPTCATGRLGEVHQHRDSALVQDNLLLVPVVDGELRGYIELMQERVTGSEDKILTVKTIQFEGLTENGAHTLFSYLHHKAKAAGFIGLAFPQTLRGRTNIGENKRIIEGLPAYQKGRTITVTPLHENEWKVARQSFGASGGTYYEGDFILLNEAHLAGPNAVSIESLECDLAIRRKAGEVEKEKFKSARPEVLLVTYLALTEKAQEMFVALLEAYGHRNLVLLIPYLFNPEESFRRIQIYLDRAIPREVVGLEREEGRLDLLEYVFKSVPWQTYIENEARNAGFMVDLYDQFITALGKERFIRSYQESIKIRLPVIVSNAVPTHWLIALSLSLSGNAVREVLSALSMRSNCGTLSLSESDADRFLGRVPVFLADGVDRDIRNKALDVFGGIAVQYPAEAAQLLEHESKDIANAAFLRARLMAQHWPAMTDSQIGMVVHLFEMALSGDAQKMLRAVHLFQESFIIKDPRVEEGFHPMYALELFYIALLESPSEEVRKLAKSELYFFLFGSKRDLSPEGLIELLRLQKENPSVFLEIRDPDKVYGSHAQNRMLITVGNKKLVDYLRSQGIEFSDPLADLEPIPDDLMNLIKANLDRLPRAPRTPREMMAWSLEKSGGISGRVEYALGKIFSAAAKKEQTSSPSSDLVRDVREANRRDEALTGEVPEAQRSRDSRNRRARSKKGR
ncbi:MAG: hypothetical protein HY390_04115 [Deltaproteobacteria bacterium]|nr:hypothetical protein [Deltaproteobacteria bacterium]